MKNKIFLFVVFAMLTSSAASGDVHHVDASCVESVECHITIAAAIAVAAHGDTILIEPGDYDGFDSTGMSLTFLSANADPQTCTVTPPILLGGVGTVTTLDGLGFQRPTDGSQISSARGDVNFHNCLFTRAVRTNLEVGSCKIDKCATEDAYMKITFNDTVRVFDSSFQDEILLIVGPGTTYFERNVTHRQQVVIQGQRMQVLDCEFRDNASGWPALFLNGNIAVVTSCGFFNNGLSGTGMGNALSLRCSRAFISRSLFIGNKSNRGGAIHTANITEVFVAGHCTFIGNEASEGSVFRFFTEEAEPIIPLIKHCIMVNQVGSSVFDETDGFQPSVLNTNIHGTEGGDWVGTVADQLGQDGNISAAPCFCDQEAGNYGLCANSPCLPENNPGGEEYMGAVDEVCSACSCGDDVGAETKSMSSMKSLFR